MRGGGDEDDDSDGDADGDDEGDDDHGVQAYVYNCTQSV